MVSNSNTSYLLYVFLAEDEQSFQTLLNDVMDVSVRQLDRLEDATPSLTTFL